MVRILGALLIGAVTAYMGISLSDRMKGQLRDVSALRNAVLLLKPKLIFYRMPLPAALREAAEEQAGRFSALFARAAGKLETVRRKPAERILRECLEEEPGLWLPEGAMRCCRRLFAALGQADAAQQEELLNRTLAELDGLERQLQADIRQKSRCFCALGICGGLAIAIILV